MQRNNLYNTSLLHSAYKHTADEQVYIAYVTHFQEFYFLSFRLYFLLIILNTGFVASWPVCADIFP